jgi:hypothetical protein
MQLVYSSDSYVVVQFEVPRPEGGGARSSGGFEIVDRFARKEIFLEGFLAERFEAGVKALVADADDKGPSTEALDEYIAGFTVLAQQPVLLH